MISSYQVIFSLLRYVWTLRDMGQTRDLTADDVYNLKATGSPTLLEFIGTLLVKLLEEKQQSLDISAGFC